MWLFGGTVPPNNSLFGGTVPPNNSLFGGSQEELFRRIIGYSEELFCRIICYSEEPVTLCKNSFFAIFKLTLFVVENCRTLTNISLRNTVEPV